MEFYDFPYIYICIYIYIYIYNHIYIHILGMSSSQLTNEVIFFRGLGGSTTKQSHFPWHAMALEVWELFASPLRRDFLRRLKRRREDLRRVLEIVLLTQPTRTTQVIHKLNIIYIYIYI